MRYLRVDPNSILEPYAGGRPFRAVVIVEDKVDPQWQAAASKWLVESGCVYMSAWGRECSSWDTSVDLANMQAFNHEEIPDNHFVVTTAHENEPLSEAFWFAKYCAFSATVEIVDTIILHVSQRDRSEEYMRLYVAL